MSRRNPRGSSAAKRRQWARSAKRSRPWIQPLAALFFRMSHDLGMVAGARIGKLIDTMFIRPERDAAMRWEDDGGR